MKYVSRNMNLRIVLAHALPAEPITGRVGRAGNYVKFESGIATVNDPDQIDLMEKHPAFGSDFIRVEEEARDPFDAQRGAAEPEHDLIDITHGGIGKNQNPRGKPSLSVDQKQYALGVARELAADLVKGMREEIKADILKSMRAETVSVPEFAPDEIVEAHLPADVELTEVEPPSEVSGDPDGPSLEDTLAAAEKAAKPKTKKKAAKKVATESAE